MEEKLQDGVGELSKVDDDEVWPQKRLRDAWTYLVRLSPKDFPDDLRPSFESIRSRISSRTALWDEGTVSATTAAMSDQEAKQLITDIVSLLGSVREAIGRRG